MGLDLILFDMLHHGPPTDWQEDTRFDSSRHIEDREFVEWLDKRNAVYKLIGDPEAFDHLRRIFGVSADNDLEEAVANQEERIYRELFRGYVYVRPKDFAAAREWVSNHQEPYRGDAWDKQRLLDLLDLLEADSNLWLFESW